jgi:hypothetical protein
MLEAYKGAYEHLRVYPLQNEDDLAKRLRVQIILDFAKLQGYEDNKLKRLEDVLARAKDVDEAISEFRKLEEGKQAQPLKNTDRHLKNIIVKGDNELLRKLEDGYSLVQPLDGEKFLMKL